MAFNLIKKLLIIGVTILTCVSTALLSHHICWNTSSLFDAGILSIKDLLDGSAVVQLKSVTTRKYHCTDLGGGTIILKIDQTGKHLWCGGSTTQLFILGYVVFNKEYFVGLKVMMNGNGVDVFAESTTRGISETFQIVRKSDDLSRVRIKASKGLIFLQLCDNLLATQAKTDELLAADCAKNSATAWEDDDPSVFVMTNISGEFQVTNIYGPQLEAPEIIMREHYYWRKFAVEDEFKFISENGLKAVRIPVISWWNMANDLQALDHAFSWAQIYGLDIIIDLQAAPEYSQNGCELSSFMSDGSTAVDSTHYSFTANNYAKLTTTSNGYNEDHQKSSVASSIAAVTSGGKRKLATTAADYESSYHNKQYYKRKPLLPASPAGHEEPEPEPDPKPKPKRSTGPMDSSRFETSRYRPSPPPPPESPRGPTPKYNEDHQKPSEASSIAAVTSGGKRKLATTAADYESSHHNKQYYKRKSLLPASPAVHEEPEPEPEPKPKPKRSTGPMDSSRFETSRYRPSPPPPPESPRRPTPKYNEDHQKPSAASSIAAVTSGGKRKLATTAADYESSHHNKQYYKRKSLLPASPAGHEEPEPEPKPKPNRSTGPMDSSRFEISRYRPSPPPPPESPRGSTPKYSSRFETSRYLPSPPPPPESPRGPTPKHSTSPMDQIQSNHKYLSSHYLVSPPPPPPDAGLKG